MEIFSVIFHKALTWQTSWSRKQVYALCGGEVIFLLKCLFEKKGLKPREENSETREYIELLEKYYLHGKVATRNVNHIIRGVKSKKNVCTTIGRYINVSVLLEIKIFSCVISANDEL